jgi:hypothetical protein
MPRRCSVWTSRNLNQYSINQRPERETFGKKSGLCSPRCRKFWIIAFTWVEYSVGVRAVQDCLFHGELTLDCMRTQWIASCSVSVSRDAALSLSKYYLEHGINHVCKLPHCDVFCTCLVLFLRLWISGYLSDICLCLSRVQTWLSFFVVFLSPSMQIPQ